MKKVISPLLIKANVECEKMLPSFESHVHTVFSKGENKVEEIIIQSISLGLQKIAFTEHTESWLMKDEFWFEAYKAEINFCKKKYGNDIDIYLGVEAPATTFDGSLELSDAMYLDAEFVLGAAHRYPSMEEGQRVRDLSVDQAISLEYQTLMALAENPKVDSIAHVGATCTKYVGRFPKKYLKDIVASATKNEIGIEINSHYHKDIVNELWSICKDKNAWITLGSNVYQLDTLGSAYLMLKNKFKGE